MKKKVLEEIEKNINFPIFTFGVGRGHDSIFLQNIAFSSPGGTYYPLTALNKEEFDAHFEQCFIHRSIVHDVGIEIDAHQACRVISFHTLLPHIEKLDPKHKHFNSRIAFLPKRGSRSFLLQVSVRKMEKETRNQKLISVTAK